MSNAQPLNDQVAAEAFRQVCQALHPRSRPSVAHQVEQVEEWHEDAASLLRVLLDYFLEVEGPQGFWVKKIEPLVHRDPFISDGAKGG